MRSIWNVLILMLVLLLAGCNLGTDDDPDDDDVVSIPTAADPNSRPEVLITSPAEGSEFVVNDPISVGVEVRDEVGVTSVQLLANGDVVRSVASESPSGDRTGERVLSYTPRSTGDLELEVVALRGSVESAPATVNVVVRSSLSQVTATQSGSGAPIIDPNDDTCRALVNTGLNFRQGPSTDFSQIRVLAPGEVLPIVGRTEDNSWWQLRSNAVVGWVDQRFITIYGDCRNIDPARTPTPTFTPQPTATGVPPTNTTVPTDQPTPTPGLPNLGVANITGPTTLTLGDDGSVTETYSVNITNRGGPIVGQFATVARIVPSGQTFDVGVVGSLAAGQSINLTVSVTFEQAGAFVLQMETDSENEVDESDEGDNSRLFNVTVLEGDS